MAFVPIELDAYIELHMQSNPDEDREALRAGLCEALAARQAGKTCDCGNPIWVIGSAIVGHACFTCITGETRPDEDYEIADALAGIDVRQANTARTSRDKQLSERLRIDETLRGKEPTSGAVEKLDDVLEGLLDLEADRVTFEWTSDGIEVTMYRGRTGVGGILSDPLAQAIMAEVVTRGKLENRSKGFFKARIRGRQMKFVVKEYDHFGETAFEIKSRG